MWATLRDRSRCRSPVARDLVEEDEDREEVDEMESLLPIDNGIGGYMTK
jgi:hypothetical protein